MGRLCAQGRRGPTPLYKVNNVNKQKNEQLKPTWTTTTPPLLHARGTRLLDVHRVVKVVGKVCERTAVEDGYVQRRVEMNNDDEQRATPRDNDRHRTPLTVEELKDVDLLVQRDDRLVFHPQDLRVHPQHKRKGGRSERGVV